MPVALVSLRPTLKTPVSLFRSLVIFIALGLVDGMVKAQSVPIPEVVDRAAWGAKPANETLMRSQTQNEILIHHTAVRQQPKLSLEKKLQNLQAFSQKQGALEDGRQKAAWGDVPYHFYIDVSGRIGEGRSLKFAGDTNTKYDTINRIQIVVEGNFEREQPSDAQLKSLRETVIWLAQTHKVPPTKISAHNDHAQTSCPGKNLKPVLSELRDAVAKINR